MTTAPAWQPIATAPKVEGEHLLGYDEVTATQHGDPTAGVCVILWMDASEDNFYPAEWQVQPFAEGLDCIESETNITHWMPLPTAPVPA
jgi:hypothetical protein